MKKLILIVAIMVQGIIAISQTSSMRKSFAITMNRMVVEDGMNLNIRSDGQSNEMIIFSGYDVNNFSNVVAFIREAKWSTWDTMFNEKRYLYVCFANVDKCYTKQEILAIINY